MFYTPHQLGEYLSDISHRFISDKIQFSPSGFMTADEFWALPQYGTGSHDHFAGRPDQELDGAFWKDYIECKVPNIGTSGQFEITVPPKGIPAEKWWPYVVNRRNQKKQADRRVDTNFENMKSNHKRFSVRPHVVQYRIQNPSVELPSDFGSGKLGTSHLCDGGSCYEPFHLDKNLDQRLNESRKKCPGVTIIVDNFKDDNGRLYRKIISDRPCIHKSDGHRCCTRLNVIGISNLEAERIMSDYQTLPAPEIDPIEEMNVDDSS